ncbi:unnamed protein product [Symbiodinium microadriaticum]|nr:unnamed protein product [Symbiodinium microadriaticum]
MVRMCENLKACRRGCPESTGELPFGVDTVATLPAKMEDCFAAAALEEVYNYLRGYAGLFCVLQAWMQATPEELAAAGLGTLPATLKDAGATTAVDAEEDELDSASGAELLALLHGVMCTHDDYGEFQAEAANDKTQTPGKAAKKEPTSNKTKMARTLQDANFDKEDFIKRMEVTIKRKNEKEVLVEVLKHNHGSELEHFCYPLGIGSSVVLQNMYDNEWEYWVKVREHGKRRQAVSYEENLKKMKEVAEDPANMAAIEKDLGSFEVPLGDASPDAKAGPDPSAHKFAQSKEALEKFTGSVMGKIGKLRLYGKAEDRMKQATLVTAKKSFDKPGSPTEAKLKASARAAIRTARNVVKDIGLEKARGLGGLLPLAKLSEDHSERGSHSLFSKKLGLALPIPLTELPTSCKDGTVPPNIQRISIIDWVKFFLQYNHWHVFAGLRRPDKIREKKIWSAWWERYRIHDPSHPIFEAADNGKVDLCRTAAVVLHGDEGRGRRRQAFFVLSFHSVLGRGTTDSLGSKANNVLHTSTKKVRKPYLKMNLNFKGHSYTTRFVTGVLPRGRYGDGDKHFIDLLSAAYDDFKFLQTAGLVDRPDACSEHMLMQRNPSAKKRVECATFVKQVLIMSWPPAVRIIDKWDRLAEHFAFDIFHTFHLGVGKYFVGSVLAILSNFESGNVERRFQQLTAKFREWCRRTGHTMIVAKLTKDLITWEATTDYPFGSWFKADLTTTLLEWIESLEGSLTDPLFLLAIDATKCINRFFRILYSEGVWLAVETAAQTGQLASKFLRRYEQLAVQAYSDEITLFSLPPKLHPLHHFATQLLASARAGQLALNPLAYSTQMSEDLVGRPSRLSRRVGSRLVISRTLQRYLKASYAQWVCAGLIIETKSS